MKIKFKPLLVSVAIPVFVGIVSGFISSSAVSIFNSLNQPPLSPPSWLFGVVWPILYICMGICSYLIYTSNAEKNNKNKALAFYSAQLFVNFFWSIIFFNLGAFLFAFFWLVLLWVLILYTAILTAPISKVGTILLIPYLLWVTFAGYLNISIYLLN